MQQSRDEADCACLTYMLLVEDGLAGLDDPIGGYVPGLKSVNGDATMRRLVGHTSGVGARGLMRGRHGWADYSLTPITADIWRIEQILFSPVSGILTFAADGKSLQLDFGRMRHVRFAKLEPVPIAPTL